MLDLSVHIGTVLAFWSAMGSCHGSLGLGYTQALVEEGRLG